jgi:hypothetical protein
MLGFLFQNVSLTMLSQLHTSYGLYRGHDQAGWPAGNTLRLVFCKYSIRISAGIQAILTGVSSVIQNKSGNSTSTTYCEILSNLSFMKHSTVRRYTKCFHWNRKYMHRGDGYYRSIWLEILRKITNSSS